MNKEKHSHLLPNQEKWINLSVKEVKHIFTYYIVVMLIAFAWLTFDLLYHYGFSRSGFSNMIGVMMFAFPGGVVGATIYYVRKLYKSCLQDLIVDSSVLNYRKLGAKIYFYIRPIISGILAILISIGIIGGFYLLNNDLTVNDDRFFLFVTLISFYIGFCNGKIILKIDEYGENVISLMFKEDKNE